MRALNQGRLKARASGAAKPGGNFKWTIRGGILTIDMDTI